MYLWQIVFWSLNSHPHFEIALAQDQNSLHFLLDKDVYVSDIAFAGVVDVFCYLLLKGKLKLYPVFLSPGWYIGRTDSSSSSNKTYIYIGHRWKHYGIEAVADAAKYRAKYRFDSKKPNSTALSGVLLVAVIP